MVLLTHLAAYGLLLTVGAAAEIDNTVPVSALIANADALLAAGDKMGALGHFDAAIKKDPHNYLTLFKRGATYLSMGRSSQASADFDAVLSIKPDFEAALLQRARIKAKGGDWESAKRDYSAAGRAAEITELDEARKAAEEALSAEKMEDWDTCVERAGAAIVVAQAYAGLRATRARCRVHKGDVPEAVGDLAHLAQLDKGNTTPHVTIANLLFFSMNDFERSTAQLRKCLHSDPDSKTCSKLLRRVKGYEKQAKKARELREKKLWTSSNKILLGSAGDTGLIDDVAGEVADLKKDGTLNDKCPQTLLADLNEMVCDTFTEMGKPERGRKYCEETLKLNPKSLVAVIAKAQRLLDEDLFEDAVRVLEKAKEEIEGAAEDNRIRQKLQDAQILLRRSKSKDYYKVLGVSRDADERDIKRAYRKLTKQYHPDKYRGEMTAEEIQKKMSSINEAYEVLSNPELRARFDNGDDPNNPEQQQHPFFQGGGHPFAGFGGQQFVFRQGGNPFGGGSGGFNFHF